jgi:hypothetical protein
MWKMPSTALMCDRNALPRPAPSAAPFTSPAMSVMFSTAGTTDLGLNLSTRWSNRGSGTGTMDTCGSICPHGTPREANNGT